jgi:hypothetical protein
MRFLIVMILLLAVIAFAPLCFGQHYVYQSPYYGYTYYPATVWHGLHWPAGYYRLYGNAWHRYGFGYEYGVPVQAYAPPMGTYPAATPCPPNSGLSADEIQKLRLLLKQLQTPANTASAPAPSPAPAK